MPTRVDQWGTVSQINLEGQLHDWNKPALITASGYLAWCVKSLRHRDGGPAVITQEGDQLYWFNGRLHREDGPARIFADGTKEWWIHGKLHRVGGPAVMFGTGSCEWWFDGHPISKPKIKPKKPIPEKVKRKITGV